MLSLIFARVRALVTAGAPASRPARRNEPEFWILFAR